MTNRMDTINTELSSEIGIISLEMTPEDKANLARKVAELTEAVRESVSDKFQALDDARNVARRAKAADIDVSELEATINANMPEAFLQEAQGYFGLYEKYVDGGTDAVVTAEEVRERIQSAQEVGAEAEAIAQMRENLKVIQQREGATRKAEGSTSH